MDVTTEEVLKLFQSHSRIRNFLTILCYVLIVGGLFVYVFYAFNQSQTVKLVVKYKESPKEFQTEKIMMNPRMNFEHKDGQIFHIKAKKAFHKDNQEMVLYDVSSDGEIGQISAGELKISESGDHLVFSNNPVVILRKIEK